VQVGEVEARAPGAVVEPRENGDRDPVQSEPADARALPCVEALDQRTVVRCGSCECRAQTFDNRPYE
jgi:hypothetical protein